MATITHVATHVSHRLLPTYLVGRGPACSLRLDSRLVSTEHAVIGWQESGWELRDLCSKNGTYVNGRRLDAGERVPVEQGTAMAFGDPTDGFIMDSDSPPAASATSDGVTIHAEDGLLFLPDPDRAELVISETGPGRWVVASVDDAWSREAADQQFVSSGGKCYRLTLPLVRERTEQPNSMPRELSELALWFTVSRDEENVGVHVIHRGEIFELKNRSHDYLLLTLARARLDDSRNPRLPESEHGWLYVPDIADMLKIKRSQLDVLICRARQQFQHAHVTAARELIERRRGDPSKIRIGVKRLKIS